MAKFTKPVMRRVFGSLVTETPYDRGWVSAIRLCVPAKDREWSDTQGTWTIAAKYYQLVLRITHVFYGNHVLDSTGGFADVQQDTSGFEKFEEFTRRAHSQSSNNSREDRHSRRGGVPHSRNFNMDRGTLYVSEDAPGFVITASYRALAKHYHPDMPTGDSEQMKRINAAYDSLKKAGAL